MLAAHQTTPVLAGDERPRASRVRPIARRILWTVARPYARRRARAKQMEASVARLESDLDNFRKRHDEQVERLEELVVELVSTAESLRGAIAARGTHGSG